MSEVGFDPESHKNATETGEDELSDLGNLYGRAKNWFGALIWEADRAKSETSRGFLQIVAAVLFLAVAFLFVNSDFKKPDILAQTGEGPTEATSELRAGQPNFDFGPDISQDQRDQIEDATRTASDTLYTKAGVSLGDFSVHAYSSNESLVDVYMKRFNFPPEKRAEIKRRLAPATAYTEGDHDLFINTVSPGWTTNSPIAEGLVLPGRYWTVLHETFHLAQSKVRADRAAEFPMWLYECSAHYFAGQGMADAKLYDWGKIREGQIAKAATVGEDLRSMESAGGFYKAGEEHADEYALGFLAVEKLCADLPDGGSAKLMEFWSAVGRGEDWRAAFEETFDKDVGQFYSEFENYRARGFK